MGSQLQSEMRGQKDPKRVNPAFFPALYRRTDIAAKEFQQWYYRAIAVETTLSVVGGAAVVATQIPSVSPFLVNAIGVQLFGGRVLPLSIATAIALLLTVITILVRYRWQPGERWRQSRFVGESDASLAWRYGAKATDFDLGTGSATYEDADDWYKTKAGILVDQSEKLDLPDDGDNKERTALMGKLRDGSLQDRFELYRDLRAIDQREWYAGKAKGLKRTRNMWRWLLILTYAVGIALLFTHGTGLRNLVPFGLLDANYWPLVAATVGGITAYVAARHYDDLAQTYEHTRSKLSLEIDSMDDFAPEPPDAAKEAKFARWVDRIEILMDAEHQQWHTLT
jgi:hypothetical protein